MIILMASSAQRENKSEGNLVLAVPSEKVVIQLQRIRIGP